MHQALAMRPGIEDCRHYHLSREWLPACLAALAEH